MASWKEPETNHTAGDQVTPEIFNTLAENEVYLNETKITTNQVQEATVMSETSATRENLTEQDTVMGAFGKIRKWFADLRALAFKDTVVTADINNSAVTSDKIASSAVTSTKLGTSSVITSKINALAVTTEKLANLARKAGKIPTPGAPPHRIANSAPKTCSECGYDRQDSQFRRNRCQDFFGFGKQGHRSCRSGYVGRL